MAESSNILLKSIDWNNSIDPNQNGEIYGHHSATKQNQFWITVGFSQWLIKKKQKKKKKQKPLLN